MPKSAKVTLCLREEYVSFITKNACVNLGLYCCKIENMLLKDRHESNE